MNTAYISFGSNLGDSAGQIRSALKTLDSFGEITACSSFYRSRAVGPGDQPDYLNGVLAFNSGLNAEELLEVLQNIENQHGRVREIRWGARTLDLDILLFNQQTSDTEKLTLPHPRMHERNFVLAPLLEIAPDITLPDGTALAPIQQQLGMDGLTVSEILPALSLRR